MENVILNGNDITHLITSFEIYEEMDSEHIIGNAVSTQIKLKIKNKDNQLADQFDYPFVVENNEYLVYEKPGKWTGTMSLTIYDKMILTNIAYKTSLEYPVSISQQLDEMAELTGLTIDKTTLSDEVLNKTVDWYDNSMLIRNYLGFIAQCDGKNVYIENNTVVFKPIASKSHTVSFSSGYELNELIVFSKVCFDDGVVSLSKGDDTGKTLYVSKENAYIQQSDIDRIYEMYKGLSFYSFKKFNCKGIESLHLTDLLTYHDITVLPFSIKRKVNGGNAKDSIEMSGDMTISNADTVIIKDNPNLKIRRLKTIVDQNAATLEIVAEQSGNNSDEIGKLIVSTDEISTEVKKKVGEDEIISKINQTAETIKILAKLIQLEGIVTANSYFKILEDGSMEAVNGKFKGKVEGSEFIATDEKVYTYSNADINRLKSIIDGTIVPDADDYVKLDINGSKDFTSADASIINGVINGVYDNTPGVAVIKDYIKINSNNSLAIEIGRSINGITIAKNLIYGGGSQVDNGSVLVNGENVLTSSLASLAYFG